MHKDKHGNMICNVCGQAWDEHGRGGNCKMPPLPEQYIARIYVSTDDGKTWERFYA